MDSLYSWRIKEVSPTCSTRNRRIGLGVHVYICHIFAEETLFRLGRFKQLPHLAAGSGVANGAHATPIAAAAVLAARHAKAWIANLTGVAIVSTENHTENMSFLFFT